VTRRRLIGVLLLFGLAYAVLRAPEWGRQALERRLSALFGRPSTVAALTVRTLPLRIEVERVRVGGATPGSRPFLELERAVGLPSLTSGLRGLRLRELHLQGLRVHVEAYEKGGDDLPRLRLPPGGGQARLGRLVVQDAEVVVDHRRVPLALDLPDVHGTLFADAGGALTGRLSFGAGDVRVAGRPPLRLASEIQMSLRGGRLEVPSARLQSEKTDLNWRGTLVLSPALRGEFTVVGPVDLQVLDRHVLASGLGLSGHARYEGQLLVAGSKLELDGRVEGTQGEFDGIAVPRYSGAVSWKEGRLRLRDLQISALGGTGTVSVDLPPRPGQVEVVAAVEGMDAEGLSRLAFDVGDTGLSAGARGPIQLRWPRGVSGRTSGTMDLELVPGAGGRTPLWGHFQWSAEQGRQKVEAALLRTSTTRATLSGHVETDGRADLALDAESSDLAAADQMLLRLRAALGAVGAQPAEIAGAGSFRGRWRGTVTAPLFEGRFAGQEVAYLGVTWGRAEWAGSLSPLEVVSHSLVLRKEGAELWLDGSQRTGLYGEDDALDLSLRLDRWPAADLSRALRLDLPLAARLSGQARLRGHRSRPLGEAQITSAEGRFAGVPYHDLQLGLVLGEGLVRLRQGVAGLGRGTLRFHGSRTPDGVYDAAATLAGVELSDLAPGWPAALQPGGRLSGALLMQGPLERPRLQGQLRSPRLFVGDEGIGSLEATFSGTGDGALRVKAAVRSARVDLELGGSVGAAAPYAARLTLQARETSLDPFLRARWPALPAGVPLVATGEATLTGPLQRPRELGLRAALTTLDLLIPEYPVSAQAPVEVTLNEGRLQVGALHIGGESTDLVVQGGADLLGGGPLAMEARGSADLRVLSLLSPEVRGRGAARLAMSLSGDRRAPRVEGTFAVQGGALRVRRFPHGIEQLDGTLRFTHEGAQLEGATGLVGGAPVRLSGQAAWTRGAVSFDVKAAGEGLALRYPEGLRSVVDADLRLFGDRRLQWLTGQVQVKQAVWAQRYDVASELLAERRRLTDTASLESGLHYDVKVSAPGTLKVDNNLATLQARADLTLQGTAGNPVVLGRAEVDRGRVYFQGNTYLIRRGSIDFANPRKTDPLFDIEAETRVHSYRVTLRVNGTLERVYPTLSSDPYLSQVAILSLLAGADESTVATMDTRRDDLQARLAVTGAASLAAGKIAEEVGLERGAERLLGLSRFSIDPSAVRGDVGNPTARLTLGKRLTPDVALVYSVDLRGTEERLVSVEYTLSERVSLLLTRAEPGGLGFDLRLRQSR
jgi:translocation and assembly module TamB